MIMQARDIKASILDELKRRTANLEVKPCLTVIQVGDDEASNIYINQKKNMCEFIGYNFRLLKLASNIKEIELINIIESLNQDPEVTGILLQLPIPDYLDYHHIINTIDYKKDVDGLTDYNTGRLIHGNKCLKPCTAYGIMELLKYYQISVSGKDVTVISRSNLVGKPVATMLTSENATVTVCHTKTEDLKKHTKDADIIVVAAGVPNLLTADMVKEGAIIIDVGINRVDNTICGDSDYDNLLNKVSYITPVPGGVGQMTIAMLAKNIMESYEWSNE